MLLDPIVQFAGQPVSLLDHGQRAHLVGEARVGLPQLVQVLLGLLQVFGQQVQSLGQQPQVVGHRIGDAQREVAPQPGAADFERVAQAAGDAPAGPRAQQGPQQRGADRHQHHVQALGGRRPQRSLDRRRPARQQGQRAQGGRFSDEDRRQRHRRVGEDQLVS